VSAFTSASSRPACHHCGLTVEAQGRWTVVIDGQLHETCCAGCQAVSAAIADSGLQDYYRARDLPARPLRPAHVQADQLLYDDPEVQARFVRTDQGICETVLLVEGLRCGACSWLLEQVLGRSQGVIESAANLGTGRIHLRWQASQARLSDLIGTASRFGFSLQPFDATLRETQLRQTSRSRLRRLFVAGIAMMQVMMVAFPAYITADGDIEPALQSLMRWAGLVMTLPVVLYSASPFFAGAWREWQRRSPGMDTPVSLGIAAAFAASVWATLSDSGEVWFDTVTMFVFLLLGARHLEWLARLRATRAIDALSAAAPESVLKVIDGASPERIAAARLRPGDRFLTGTGEAVAVDATLQSGQSRFDLSLLTGESHPISREPGDILPGGAINLGSPVTLIARERQADSALSTIARLAVRAAAARPALLGLTETIARWFTVGLLLLSAAVWLGWHQIDPDRAWAIAIAVLVVSCPCALSLATPTAIAAASSTALRRGMVSTRADALEAMAGTTDVILDKTGTLTRGQPLLTGFAAAAELDRASCLGIAAALEESSTHPLARAIRDAAASCDAPFQQACTIHTAPGEGVEGIVAGQRWRLGSARFVLGAAHAPDPADAGVEAGTEAGVAAGAEAGTRARHTAATEVWLAREGQAVARFLLSDAVRPDAALLIEGFRARGLGLHLISGDREPTVHAVAAGLGIERWRAAMSPADKLDYVHALQAQGRKVLAIGDGINDAPLLAAADVSIAVGRASTLAKTSAAIVMLGERLVDVLTLHQLAHRTRRIILQNLAWALAYNAAAIPAAALGLIAPWVAALGMSVSSLLVAGNALRLIAGDGTPPAPEVLLAPAADAVGAHQAT